MRASVHPRWSTSEAFDRKHHRINVHSHHIRCAEFLQAYNAKGTYRHRLKSPTFLMLTVRQGVSTGVHLALEREY